MNRFPRQALYSWAFIGVLTALSVLLAILQYRWIGELSRSEEKRLKSNLHAALERLRVDFNDNISQSASSLTLAGRRDIPSDPAGREQLYIEKFKRWRSGNHQEHLFASITRIIPGSDGTAGLRQLDQQRAVFVSIEWPKGWGALRDEIL